MPSEAPSIREVVKGTGIPTLASMRYLKDALIAGQTQVFPTWLKGAVYWQARKEFKLSKMEAVAAATQEAICTATAEVKVE